jgi:hypothetical protein
MFDYRLHLTLCLLVGIAWGSRLSDDEKPVPDGLQDGGKDSLSEAAPAVGLSAEEHEMSDEEVEAVEQSLRHMSQETLDQRKKRALDVFGEIDTNKDEVVDEEELVAYMKSKSIAASTNQKCGTMEKNEDKLR